MGEVVFCPECESLLRKRSFDGKVYLSCKCGYKQLAGRNNLKKEISDEERKRKGMASKTVVLENSDKIIQNPTTDVNCPECGHTKAEYSQYQTRSADEPATTFYSCLKCKHKWREY